MTQNTSLTLRKFVSFDGSLSPYNQDSIVKYDPNQVDAKKTSKLLPSVASSCSILSGNVINFDAIKKGAFLEPDYPPPCLELIDSDEWLKRYGLQKNKLTLENVLSMIGFKQSTNYNNQVNQIISSRYSKGLFLQTQTKNGYIYNITVNEGKLKDLARRLEESLVLFKLRLQWLNSDSRRIFGVIVEKSVCLVIDCKNRDKTKFCQYRNCILKLLVEQISKISSFNILRCSDKIEAFREKSVVVSAQSIEEATNWLNEWNEPNDRFIKISTDTTTTEAVLHAFKDDTIEAIYLISEGLSSNSTREILYDKLVKNSNDRRIALNVVSFNCDDPDTVEFLRRIAQDSYGPGRFHAYCLLRYYDDYVRGPIDADPTKNKVLVNKRMFGGVPVGAGVKSDVMLIFEEIQSGVEALECIKTIIDSMNSRNANKEIEYATAKKTTLVKLTELDEEYMTSTQWLQRFGLTAKFLDLFDILRQLSFRHCDGVVDLMKEPSTGRVCFMNEGSIYYQGDSIPCPKLVNAKYCDQFAHVLWNDGTIMHVHVTPEMHRNYEDKVNMALEQFEKRIDWLSKGSRELFGTVIENKICILIDTSQSMQLSLDFVKRKLIILLQEQLKSKQKFNLLAFNSKVVSWRDRMVEVDEYTMQSAIEWINSLNAQGTTNTLAAIRFALSDLNTEAIYLLSDGRPDQEPRLILSQVHLNSRVPIHTISFNCNDADANKFLSQLAKETGGRYHYFNENGWDADPNGPVPYESEDISLLKKEIEKGQRYLLQLTKLREESARLSTNANKNKENKKFIRSTISNPEFISRSAVFQSKYRSKTSLDFARKKSVHSNDDLLSSLHDIQSLEWILPETRQLLERQYKNQINQPKLKKSEPKQSISAKLEKSTYSKQIKPIPKDSSLLKSHSKMKLWIDKNNLASLKLTIFDALQVNAHNKQQTPENMLVVDEMYEARVWNEILDLASSSGIDKNRFKFLNPSTINLNEYEDKLENQIKVYKRYLAQQIWKALPEIEKKILDYTEAPLELDETNREALFKSLQYCNWPISKQDIEEVETQIELAKKFIRISRELSFYIFGKIETNRETVNSINREISNLKVETPKEKLTEKSEVEIEKLMSMAAKKEDNISRGDRVVARNDLLGYFYLGKVSKVVDSRHANVKFDNGVKQEKMSVSNILKMNGSSTYLSVGDYVMASVINEFEQKCWVPGIVQLIDQNSYPKLYTILYFNGQEGENTRVEMIKINKNKYGFIVNYIRARLGLNTNVKPFREDKKITPPPKIDRVPTPVPDMDELKKDIMEEIKDYFDSLRLNDNYQKMYDELQIIRKKQKNYKSDLDGKFKVLRKDFDEWRKQEPPTILPNPNVYIYQDQKDVRVNEPIVKSPPPSQREPQTIEQKLLKLRSDLPKLRIGEEVLAKWPDDGWYYRSIVKDDLGNNKYQVEDSLRDMEQIYREDIISEIHDSSDYFEEGDPVIALHPKYEFSYAPGQIVKISSDTTKLLVKFYDFDESVVFRKEIYKLPRLKYQVDVENIINLEKKWIGQTVVARNNYSNVYELGKIINRVGNGRQYTIEWSNGKQSVQNANHIYGRYTRPQPILNNDYVLAPKETIYLPGRVLSRQGDQLRVKFVDGQTDENVSLDQCYWLSRDYYDDACNFYRREIDSDEESRIRVEESLRTRTPDSGRKTPIIHATDYRSGKKDKSRQIKETIEETYVIEKTEHVDKNSENSENSD